MASEPKKDHFVPKGAVAVFAIMLLSFGLIWLGIYLLALHRQLSL